MARQSTQPVPFERSIRTDNSITMTSGRAGKVVPVGYLPLLMGDSCGGQVGIDIELAEMPRPLLNAVTANMQAWFVPKSAFPQFPGQDELMNAWTGKDINALGFAARAPAPFFTTVTGVARTTVLASELFQTLGIHVAALMEINADLIDAFNVIYNFRLAAHSSKLAKRKYFAEDALLSTTLPPAFWPSSKFKNVVPDYERALIVGSMDLDVVSGLVNLPAQTLPVSGVSQVSNTNLTAGAANITANAAALLVQNVSNVGGVSFRRLAANPAGTLLDITAALAASTGSLSGQTLGVSLADINSAKLTQAFAKIRASMAGTGFNGYDNELTIIAMLMQGFPVEPDAFKRPWLLDSKRVPVGFSERFATDAANLDDSVSQGRASAVLNVNVPAQMVGGVIIFTVEVLPERIDERMSDEWLTALTPNHLPNALRDRQRTEPVDRVPNRRVDAKHTAQSGLYGFEPMNDKWNRNFTRLGGRFYQANPSTAYVEQRAAIWQTNIVDPLFTATHYLAPDNFPHTVFADTLAPAFEVVCRHTVQISGLTQIGDVLVEAGGDYDLTDKAGL